MAPKVDVHVHVVPPSFAAAVQKEGDPSGWTLPKWTPELAIQSADDLNVSLGILSVTAPGPVVFGTGHEARDLARRCNDEVQEIVRVHPDRFSFFATTPSWEDVEGTLAEIDYAYNTLNAAGIVTMTQYGDHLLGDDLFRPIWDKLEAHRAVVFVHPTSPGFTPKNIAGWLPGPVVDYTLATTRTAADLILTGTVASHPNVKIILSHAGGTLPYIAERIASLGSLPDFAAKSKVSEDEIRAGLRGFYVDTALSASEAQIAALLKFTTPDKILFGSDWPYAPTPVVKQFTSELDRIVGAEQGSLQEVDQENASRLFGDRIQLRRTSQ